MNNRADYRRRTGHTLMEMVMAMIASAVLLAGLGSVMLIARQVAYTPSAASRRTEAANVISQLTDELQYATLLIGQSTNALEFVVADRNADGTAEKIRYEWSGTSGDPLRKTVNGGASVAILDSVQAFAIAIQSVSKTTTLATTADSAEAILQSNTSFSSLTDRDISAMAFSAQQINPSLFPSIPANATLWNATKVDFYGMQESGVSGQVLSVQLRSAGEPANSPTSNVLAQASIPKASLTSSLNWNTAVFTAPARGLSLNRRYDIAFTGSADKSVRLCVSTAGNSGVFESEDAGASWRTINPRQIYYRLYGTYTTPGPSYDVTRNFASHVRVVLQSGGQSTSRIDASVPLLNRPELLTAYWRTNFDRDPTTTNANGDAAMDWAMASGSFDPATLSGGVWYASGALETRPLNDFTQTTFVDVRCRNTTMGGNGAVLRINADRQGGQYAPLLVYLQRQADDTQTLILSGKTSDAATKQLFSRSRLPSGFVQVRLTILPQNNVVNLTINEEDQGTFTYPTCAPSSSTDRFLTLYADTSLAEFDYADVRVATN